jgi:hypothetical protein
MVPMESSDLLESSEPNPVPREPTNPTRRCPARVSTSGEAGRRGSSGSLGGGVISGAVSEGRGGLFARLPAGRVEAGGVKSGGGDAESSTGD